jgi:hypothetical protein
MCEEECEDTACLLEPEELDLRDTDDARQKFFEAHSVPKEWHKGDGDVE